MASAWSQQEIDQLRTRFEELGRTAESAQGAEGSAIEPALEMAYAELAREADDLRARVAADIPAEAAAPAADPAAGPLLALEKLLRALEMATPAVAGRMLKRAAKLLEISRDPTTRAAIEARLFAYFDETTHRLKGGKPEVFEAFAFSIHDALRGTHVLEGHPLAAMLRGIEKARANAATATTVAAEAAKEHEAGVAAARSLAEKIVEKITGRLDGASRIIASRMVGFALETKASEFTTDFEDRVLGANLSVLERFESAVKLPEKFFDFDERFKIASSIFPDGVAVGSDGASLAGSLGKFAWLLGADLATHEGYGSAVANETLEYAERVAPVPAESSSTTSDVGLGALGNLGALAGPGFDLSRLGGSGAVRRFEMPALRAERSSPLGGGRGFSMPALPNLSEKLSSLPSGALRAIQTGDVKALGAALGGSIPLPALEAVMQSPVVAQIRQMPPISSGGIGDLSHLALGFQSMAASTARDAGMRSLERLSFGGRQGGGLGFVASSSTSYLPRASRGMEVGGAFASAAPSLEAPQGMTLASRLMPSARRSLGLDIGALERVSISGSSASRGVNRLAGMPAPMSFDMPAQRPASLRAVSTPAYQAGLAAPRARAQAAVLPQVGALAPTISGFQMAESMPAVGGAEGVSTYAISSDRFGLPRYRGAARLPAAALGMVEGFDFSGSSVFAGARRSADRGGVAAAARPATPGGRQITIAGAQGFTPGAIPEIPGGFGYTEDDFGITRIESRREAARRMTTVRPADVAMRSIHLGAPRGQAQVGLSELDLAGGVGPQHPLLASIEAASVRRIGVSSLPQVGGGLGRSFARQAVAGQPFALGAIELAFPAASGAPAMGRAQASPSIPTIPLMGGVPAGAVAPRALRGVERQLFGAASAPAPVAGVAAAVSLATPGVQALAPLSARGARITAPRTLVGSVPADLALVAQPAQRPGAIDKYYRAPEARGLALGGIAEFSLPSFGPARRQAAGAQPAAMAGDFASPGLARLAGVTIGGPRRMELPGVRLDVPEGADGIPTYDAAGFAPATRMGGVATAASRYASLADDRYGRVGRDLEAMRDTYSGARMWRTGTALALPTVSLDDGQLGVAPALGALSSGTGLVPGASARAAVGLGALATPRAGGYSIPTVAASPLGAPARVGIDGASMTLPGATILPGQPAVAGATPVAAPLAGMAPSASGASLVARPAVPTSSDMTYVTQITPAAGPAAEAAPQAAPEIAAYLPSRQIGVPSVMPAQPGSGPTVARLELTPQQGSTRAPAASVSAASYAAASQAAPASYASVPAPQAAPAFAMPARRVVSGRAIARSASLPVGYVPTPAEAGARQMMSGAQAWRAESRIAAPRVAGVYRAPAATASSAAPTPGDVLGLAQHGGIESAHAPTAVNPRYVTLGMDTHLAPVVDRMTRRSAPAERLQFPAQQLESVLGGVPQVGAAPLALPAAAIGAPARTVVPAAARRAIAPDGRPVQSARRPVHRFIDQLEMPGQALGTPATIETGEPSAPASTSIPAGTVFGLVPKAVRGSFSDRFALDGWTKGNIRNRGGVDAGLGLRDSSRSLDVSIDHEVIRFPGDITRMPAAAIPVDLTSQLTGRPENIEARGVAEGRSMGLVFEPRPYEMPLRGILWGRPNSDRVARGDVQVREVEFPSRFAALDPTVIEGALKVENRSGTATPANYRLAEGKQAQASAAAATPAGGRRSVTQTPGAARADSKDRRVGATFSENSTSVHAEGRLAADIVAAPAFRSAITPAAEVLPKSSDFLRATGLDLARAEQVMGRNREIADHTRQSYVRRGGLPNPEEWTLSVSTPMESVPAEASLALQFKRSRGPAEARVEPDSQLGRRIRQTRGKPLSSPVLDFMESFFKRDLGGVRVSEGAPAQAINRELGSEAVTSGNEIYIAPTTPRGEPALAGASAERLGTVAHEVSHAIDNRATAPAARPSAPAPTREGERRARDAERKIVALLRREPQNRHAPKMDMTHAAVGDKKAAQQASIQAEKNPIQKKKAADTQIQGFEKSGSLVPKPWEALFPRPPKRDLTPLVYQIWNKIKKDLSIEMERRSGGF